MDVNVSIYPHSRTATTVKGICSKGQPLGVLWHTIYNLKEDYQIG